MSESQTDATTMPERDARGALAAVADALAVILIEQLGDAPHGVWTIDSRIIEDLKADTMDMLGIVFALEEAFGITIPDPDPHEWVTVRDIVRYLTARLERGRA